MSEEELAPINEQDFKNLKERMKLIVEADPTQYHNDFSLRRYLRAFKTTDAAFQVSHVYLVTTTHILTLKHSIFLFCLLPPDIYIGHIEDEQVA